MKFPNKYLRNIKPYKLASHKIWAVPAENRKTVLKLDWNEATIPPTPLVDKAIRELLNQPSFYNLYPSTLNDELLEKLSSYLKLPTQYIQYFGSSDSLHEYICKVFISVGDPVLILGPSYDNFRLTCQANGAEIFRSDFNPDFTFNSERFENDIREIDPAVVYICNPNNPTGTALDVDYIKYLLEEFPDTLFLIDEAYSEFSGCSCKDLVIEFDNILISRTMSKAFALANFRVGYLISSRDNVASINRIRNPKNLTTFAQTAAIAALSDIEYMWRYVSQVNKAKSYFQNGIEKFREYFTTSSSGGNFLILKFENHQEKMALMEFLASREIFVRDCTQGEIVKNCLRITIGTKEQMDIVLSALDDFYESK